jgi:oligosaccharide repeat unit polymerase
MHIENKKAAFRLTLLVLVVWLPLFALLALEPQLELVNGRLISQKTALINCLGVACILIGIVLRSFLAGDRRISKPFEPWGLRADSIALTILLLLALLGAFLSALAWRELGIDPLSIGERTLYEMNVVYAQEERVISGLPGRLTALALVGLLYALYLQRQKRINSGTGFVFAILFIILMISPRRALLLSSLISSVMLWYLSQDKIKFSHSIRILIPVVAIVLSFGFTQYLLQKTDAFSLFDSIKLIVEYYVYSFYVMDALIDTSHFENTFIILSVPDRILSYIFSYSPNVHLSVPFIYFPKAANTVPAFYYFYKSGGFVCVAAASFVIGWLLTHLFIRMQAVPSLFNVIAASLFATGIVLSPRQCIFIEYDFIFLIFIAFVLDALRKSRWLRGNPHSGPVLRLPQPPTI